MAMLGVRSPYPYFGGKSAIANAVWERFGDVQNFVDPFLGSNAFLLARPEWDWGIGSWRDGKNRIETVNDADGFIANFWRAVRAEPDAVAEAVDWPVNENDLHARHIWLVGQRESLTSRLEGDPGFYDAKTAGWWVWGMCCWIGGGFCSGEGPWSVVDGQLVHLGDAGRGVNRQLVHLGDAGRGVNRQLVHLGNAGRGVNRQLVHLGNAGRGVNRRRIAITNDGIGVTRNSGGVYEWMRALSERLRYVRVASGDWSRVCGPTPTTKQGLTGVFLDPPYPDDAGRADSIYALDDLSVGHDVREWAIANGNDPLMRIALCGYDSLAMPEGWTMLRWKSHGGYGSQGDGSGRSNASREVIWFNRNCLRVDGPAQLELFGEATAHE